MSFWVSSGAFGLSNINGILEQAQKSNILNIELSSGLCCDNENLKQIIERVHSGKNKFLIHNYFPAPQNPFVLNIASANEDDREKTKLFAKKAIDISTELGAPFYSIHAGFAASLSPKVLGDVNEWQKIKFPKKNFDKIYEIMIKTTQELSDYACSKNLSLLIENNVLSPLSHHKETQSPILLNHYEDIDRFMRDVDRKNVGLLLDLGHAKVSAKAHNINPNNYVEKLFDYISCLHLSENNGYVDSNDLIKENTWFLNYLNSFKEKEIVLEVYNLKLEQILAQIDLVLNNMEN